MADRDTNAERVSLVTGASGLLGGCVARRLCAAGTPTALHYATNADRAHAIASSFSTPALPVWADLADPLSVSRMTDTVQDRLGPVTTLVHCAAVADDGLLVEQSEERWRAVIDINLVGTYRVVKAVLPTMIRNRVGRVVLISSPSATHGLPGQTSYAAAKAGVLGLVRTLAVEYASRNVTVNSVSPGFMDSALTAGVPEAARARIASRTVLGRKPIDPEQVVDAIMLLVDSQAVTGQNIAVDGGFALE